MSGADHPYVPKLLTVPGVGWVLAFTIAAEIGDISRFETATKLTGYTGLCPRVVQSGESDRRGPLPSRGPAICAGRCSRRPCTRSPPRLLGALPAKQAPAGKQRGAKVAQIDIARKLTVAIWHMLTHNQSFAPRGAALRLAA